ncbi:MAG: hypothetical protein WKG07_42035 [Hymenobacter sp.]
MVGAAQLGALPAAAARPARGPGREPNLPRRAAPTWLDTLKALGVNLAGHFRARARLPGRGRRRGHHRRRARCPHRRAGALALRQNQKAYPRHAGRRGRAGV